MSDAIAAGYAKLLASGAGVVAKPLLKAGIDEPVNANGQLEGDGVLAALQPIADRMRRLYDSPKALFVLLTRIDLNNTPGGTRYLFSYHNFDTNLSVVSAARCTSPGRDGPATDELVFRRLYKLLLRAVGEQVLHLPRSGDPSSAMYSPLMSVDDLDMIGTTLGTRL